VLVIAPYFAVQKRQALSFKTLPVAANSIISMIALGRTVRLAVRVLTWFLTIAQQGATLTTTTAAAARAFRDLCSLI
jgi:hypothetical protein